MKLQEFISTFIEDGSFTGDQVARLVAAIGDVLETVEQLSEGEIMEKLAQSITSLTADALAPAPQGLPSTSHQAAMSHPISATTQLSMSHSSSASRPVTEQPQRGRESPKFGMWTFFF